VSEDTHDCPHPTCGRQVPLTQFACRNHWYRIPKDMRDAIWAGYRSGDTLGHMQAMSDARRWLRENP
jgi:hypothetical protein